MIKTGRRDFFKTAGIFSALLGAKPFFGKADAKDLKEEKSSPEYRTLGTGSAAMKVAPLGFGCMGMNYNRSKAKDEKEMIRLLHKCVDYGVNLFDTAEEIG